MGSRARGLEQLLRPVVKAMGYQFWGLDFSPQGRGALLRVYIEAEQGITLDDCGRVSHQLSGVLDVQDPIRAPYTLEVSSPGLDRPLFRPEQFRRYLGHRIRVRITGLVEGRRNFVGELLAVRDGDILLRQDHTDYTLALEAIERARLVPQL
jgi:ribosome maturation factor RimP